MVSDELTDVPQIAEAVEALKVTSYSKEELEQYEKYWDILRTQQTFVNDALKKGKLEGEEENKQTTAKKLIKKGFPNEEFADITGLSIGVIDALRKGIN